MVRLLAKLGSEAVAVTPSATMPAVAFVLCAGMMCFQDSVVTRVKANWPSNDMSSRLAVISRLMVVGTVNPPSLLVVSFNVLVAWLLALLRTSMALLSALPRRYDL